MALSTRRHAHVGVSISPLVGEKRIENLCDHSRAVTLSGHGYLGSQLANVQVCPAVQLVRQIEKKIDLDSNTFTVDGDPALDEVRMGLEEIHGLCHRVHHISVFFVLQTI